MAHIYIYIYIHIHICMQHMIIHCSILRYDRPVDQPLHEAAQLPHVLVGDDVVLRYIYIYIYIYIYM